MAEYNVCEQIELFDIDNRITEYQVLKAECQIGSSERSYYQGAIDALNKLLEDKFLID
jgi:hypothetical protein